METVRDLTVVRPGDGSKIMLGPDLGVDFKLRGDDTGDTISVVEHPFAVGALVPPHIHTREDEYSIVIEGSIGFRAGDDEVVLETGGYITKPRNLLHSMWNAGSVPGRIIEIISPAGFERYFDELAELIATSTGDADLEAIGELAARYGLSFDMGWVPDLIERYNVHMMF